MKRTFYYYILLLFCVVGCNQKAAEKQTQKKPNIIIIYADDLGYGDLSCYGATEVQTPNIDKLAAGGVKFTDAHCAAATCTPSRYALLTGNYAFRMNVDILPGDAPLLIQPSTPTIPALLSNVGYKTAAIGKWHLGLGNGNLNWNDSIKPGPLEIGFDECFLIPSTGDRVPSVYLENYHLVGLDKENPLKVNFTDNASDENTFKTPTGLSNPELLKIKADTQHSGTIVNGVSRIGFMEGSEAAYWKDEDMADLLTQKAISFIEKNQEKPFFLYFPLHDIHVPRMPHQRFEGKTKMGARGDAIVQMDWCVGEIMKKVEELGIAENTLIIFSSDNGAVLNDGYDDESVELLGKHKPTGDLKGGKYSIYEGGNRVPTIAYWKSVITPQESNALWNQVDLLHTFSKLCEYEIPKNAAKDSQNMLDVLLGKSKTGREIMLEEAITYAIRQGNWKYIAPTNKKHDWIKAIKGIEGGASSKPQLYNLEVDMKEENNLADKYPDKVNEMQKELEKILKND